MIFIFSFTLILFYVPNSYLKKVVEGLYPYMAVIYEYCGSNDDPDQWHLYDLMYQGSLLTPLWILTTSRYKGKPKLRDWKTHNFDALVGFTGNDDIHSAIRRNIIEWISFGYAYEVAVFTIDDIALCKVNEPIQEFPVIRIPSNRMDLQLLREASDYLLSNSNCSYVGWVQEIEVVSVRVRVLSVTEFYKSTGSIGVSMNLYTKQSTDDIRGGAGAASVCDDVQVGIYLYELNGFGIYMKVASYLPWIYTVLKIDTVSKHLRISNIINKVEERSVAHDDKHIT